MLKVLFHVDEEVMWNLALKNVQNFVDEIADGNMIFIEVVANGDAINAYININEQRKIEKLRGKVRFVACKKSLRTNGISENMLPYFVEIVPSGVVEIAKREEEGYRYIKP